MMDVTRYSAIKNTSGLNAKNPYFSLKSDTILENGYFTITVHFITCLFSTGNRYDFVDKLWQKFFHRGSFGQNACVEVNPIRFVACKITVGGYLHRRYECSEWRSSTCGEQYDMASA